MDLVLKLPKGKPPFIGVLFGDDGGASLLNADLIHHHKNKSFRIILEQFKHHVNLRLICEEMVTVRFYNHLQFNAETLQSWLYVSNGTKSFNFSHLIMRGDKLMVETASPGKKLFVLRIEKCEVVVAK